MTEFLWTSGPEGSNSDQPSEPDSGFAALGLVPEAATTSASVVTTDTHDDNPPLTRRELRAREQAALAAASAPAVMAERATAPQMAPAPQIVPAAAEAQPVAATPAAADNVASTDMPSRRSLNAPKKPKALRAVRLPRGMTLSRMPVTAPSRPSAAFVQRKPFKRRMLKKMMTFGAMVGASLMIVATTIPANAFYPNSDQADAATSMALTTAPVAAEVQSISVEPSADLSFTRDGYTGTSLREQIFLRYGNRTFLYSNNPNGTIQWPFAISVPVSDGYGDRIAPCGGCSSFHKGVDFTPGAGATIQAIADGVVSAVIPSHSGLGNHVIIDHTFNGQLVQSVYAHMRDDSMRVVVGQVVKVKDTVGLVGTTGESTGPHLHFEMHIGGVPIDAFEWLKANAN